MREEEFDYLIVGAGIVGMSIAYSLKEYNKNSTIAIVEKENRVALHSSGRNSGILHAGFYYSADTLKAKFTKEGNVKMRLFCKENNIEIKETKKIVVAQNRDELRRLYELNRRARVNRVEAYLIDESELKRINPNIKTYKLALFSPTTASVDPKEVCSKLEQRLKKMGVKFFFNTPFENSTIKYRYLINSAGAYADKIAKRFKIAKQYTMIPFKGIYLKYLGEKKNIKTNIYPVPNLKNPFLGIHFTVTAKGDIKIGPTATPAFWRENYQGFDNFRIDELLETVYYLGKLFLLNPFNFRELAVEEIKNYNRKNLILKAKSMVKELEDKFIPLPAGIRAQLLNRDTNELVEDFIVEHTPNSTHILNAVSPAFTCSFAFAEYVVDEIYKNQKRDKR